MKLNWGTSIVIAFIAFIGFILFMVVRMSSEQGNHDLVTEDYYRAELAYQKEIDAENNAKNNAMQLQIKKTSEGLEVAFPQHLKIEKITGTVSLYRPSNKHLDFDLPISLSNTHLLIPDKRLLDGRWDIKVAWEYQEEEYLLKDSITY